MNAWQKVEALLSTLEARGQAKDARALMRELRDLRNRRFPEPLHVARERFEDAYLDLEAKARATKMTASFDAGRAQGGRGRSDRTHAAAVRDLQLQAVDADLLDLFERHREALTGGQASRQGPRVWRDQEAQEALPA